MIVKHQAVEYCCGAEVLFNLGYSKNTPQARPQYNLKVIDSDLETYGMMKHVAIRSIYLADEQVPYIEPLLIKHGWKLVVKDAYHHSQKSKISMYVLITCASDQADTHKVGGLDFHNLPIPPVEAVKKPLPTADVSIGPVNVGTQESNNQVRGTRTTTLRRRQVVPRWALFEDF